MNLVPVEHNYGFVAGAAKHRRPVHRLTELRRQQAEYRPLREIHGFSPRCRVSGVAAGLSHHSIMAFARVRQQTLASVATVAKVANCI